MLRIASGQTTLLIRTILALGLPLHLMSKQVVYLLIVYLVEADTDAHQASAKLNLGEHVFQGSGQDPVLGSALANLVSAYDGVGLACPGLAIGKYRPIHAMQEALC